jgi:hypothetical protein
VRLEGSGPTRSISPIAAQAKSSQSPAKTSYRGMDRPPMSTGMVRLTGTAAQISGRTVDTVTVVQAPAGMPSHEQT